MGTHPLPQKLLAEALGSALLLAVVIGSGIMAERLAGGNLGVALLANTLATVGGLYVLIEVFAPISGAHLNPAISLVMAARGELQKAHLVPYILMQLGGAVLGAWLAHAMFAVDLLQFSTHIRSGWGQWLAEAVATAGLVLVVLRAPKDRVAGLVSAYVGAAYWFTASTSFANPAAALGRMFTDSFAGIAPASVPAFVLAELAGAAAGVILERLFAGSTPRHPDALAEPRSERLGQLLSEPLAGDVGLAATATTVTATTVSLHGAQRSEKKMAKVSSDFGVPPALRRSKSGQ
jgi:glycerol uptake facilitator-like aquaporin